LRNDCPVVAAHGTEARGKFLVRRGNRKRATEVGFDREVVEERRELVARLSAPLRALVRAEGARGVESFDPARDLACRRGDLRKRTRERGRAMNHAALGVLERLAAEDLRGLAGCVRRLADGDVAERWSETKCEARGQRRRAARECTRDATAKHALRDVDEVTLVGLQRAEWGTDQCTALRALTGKRTERRGLTRSAGRSARATGSDSAESGERKPEPLTNARRDRCRRLHLLEVCAVRLLPLFVGVTLAVTEEGREARDSARRRRIARVDGDGFGGRCLGVTDGRARRILRALRADDVDRVELVGSTVDHRPEALLFGRSHRVVRNARPGVVALPNRRRDNDVSGHGSPQKGFARGL
jgi:hypothetical protein